MDDQVGTPVAEHSDSPRTGVRRLVEWVLRRVRAPRDIACILAAAVATCEMTRAHLLFFSPPAVLNGFDEGYVVAFARRMLDGSLLPYVDAVSHRGPVLYWVAALSIALGKPFSWRPIRILALSASVLNILLPFLCARRAGYPLAGAVAALAVPIALLLGMIMPMDGMAFGGELLLNVFALASLGCVTLALTRPLPSIGLVLGAGVLAALAALSKQLGAVLLPALFLWPALAALSRPDLRHGQRWLLFAAFPLGAAVIAGALIIRYALAGELQTLFYYLVTYNSSVYMAPLDAVARINTYRNIILERVLLVAAALPVVMWGLTRGVAQAKAWRNLLRACDEQGFIITVALSAALTLLFGNAALRDFGHYYIMHLPWFALLFGLVIERAGLPAVSPRVREVMLHTAILLPACVLLHIAWNWRRDSFKKDKKDNLEWRNPKAAPICEIIKRYSTPKDTLFVWGFMPVLYTSCERRAASRYVFTTFLAGFVPWYDEARSVEDQRSVPGGWSILLRELSDAQPAVIVDAPTLMGPQRSLTTYPPLANFVKNQYCFIGVYDSLPVYVRPRAGVACAR